MKRLKKVLFFLLTGFFLFKLFSFGSGFMLFEHGTRANGFAGAFTAQANDASAIFYNPAGIAFLDGYQLYLGATFIIPKTTFYGANPFPGYGVTEKMASQLFYPPGFHFVMPIGEKLRIGLGLFSPFGLATKWDNPDNFTGRYISQYVDLKHLALSPVVSYKFSDKFALGIGLDVRTSGITFEKNIPFFNPFTFSVIDIAHVKLSSGLTNYGVGFSFGALYRPSDRINIGFSYRHKVKVDFEGDAEFIQKSTGNPILDSLIAAKLPFGKTSVKTSITFPTIVSLGFASNFIENWVFELDLNWTEWSTYDRLFIEFPKYPELNSDSKKYYVDVFHLRLGAERKIGEKTSLRCGYVFDPSPSLPESVSTQLPDSDRHGFALGFSYNIGKNVWADFSYIYLLFEKRSTEGRNSDGYEGDYKSYANLFGISIGYKF
ncbi:MAG: OmpP1/FadL family transporter [Acidobacteriota bacterium]